MDAAKGSDDPVVPKWVHGDFFNPSPLRGEDRHSRAERDKADLGDFRSNSVGFSSMLRMSRHCRMVSRWRL